MEVPRARALVKSAHITPLKMRFSPKNICRSLSVYAEHERCYVRTTKADISYVLPEFMGIIVSGKQERTALTTTSTPFSTLARPIKFAMLVAKLVVSSVVVLPNVSNSSKIVPPC